jgi:hypothetical protein
MEQNQQPTEQLLGCNSSAQPTKWNIAHATRKDIPAH